MQHLHSLQKVSLKASWVTVGTYDGIHLGHQAIIKPMVEGAHAAGLPAVVVNFFPHPATILRGITGPFALTMPDERARLMGEMGVDFIVTMRFNKALSSLSAHEFMKLIQKQLHLQQLWVGYNFALGYQRDGTPASLQGMGAEMGYLLKVVEPVRTGGQVISSSLVRTLLERGRVKNAVRLLGHPYAVTGQVEKSPSGETVLLPPNEQVLPPPGTYAAILQDRRLKTRLLTAPARLVVDLQKTTPLPAGQNLRLELIG